MRSRFLAICLVVLTVPIAAQAQDWKKAWQTTIAQAKGQTLKAIVAGEDAYQLVLQEFGKKFGVEIEASVMRPSVALSRVRTEQQSGHHGWDIWLGGTSNMVNSASPGGLLDPMEPYFILPEVTESANWRHADFIFGDSRRSVFTSSNKVEYYVLRNTKVVPDVKVENWDDLLNPKFKGKIASRDLSVPNAGTFAVATAYGVKGADFVRKLLKDQEPVFYANPQQLDAAITRGSAAISIGLETYLWDKCRADGGCKEVERLWQFGSAISIGMSVPKNAPDKAAVTAFVNWFLSKEGQTFFVEAWGKQNISGAVSMRKDVPPTKGHENSLPDFSNPGKYVFVSSERGSEEIADTIKIYKEVTGR